MERRLLPLHTLSLRVSFPETRPFRRRAPRSSRPGRAPPEPGLPGARGPGRAYPSLPRNLKGGLQARTRAGTTAGPPKRQQRNAGEAGTRPGRRVPGTGWECGGGSEGQSQSPSAPPPGSGPSPPGGKRGRPAHACQLPAPSRPPPWASADPGSLTLPCRPASPPPAVSKPRASLPPTAPPPSSAAVHAGIARCTPGVWRTTPTPQPPGSRWCSPPSPSVPCACSSPRRT